MHVSISSIGQHAEQSVTISGWLSDKSGKGKLQFLKLRDGSGFIQATVFKQDVSEDDFELAKRIPQESSLEITGLVRADARAPGGFELSVTGLKVVALPTEEYPITPKEHGTEFLLDYRHLHLRHRKPWAAMRVRDTIKRAIHDFFWLEGIYPVR